MTTEERLKYTNLAFRLAGIECDQYVTELVILTVDGVKKKGGKFTIMDSAQIHTTCKQRQDARKQNTSEDNQPRPEEGLVRPEGDPLQSAGV